MNYHIVYNNFKDYAELFIKNIDFSKANINKVLFLHIGDEEAISEIIENTNFKNAEFYIKDEDSIYDIIETLYNEKVHKFLEYNNMEFDLIIANPPYGSLGNPIISEVITHLTNNGIASVLMPLSCYKKKELYRHVETFELANPKLFKDASVQKDLCICSLRKSATSNISYFDMQNKLYDTIYGLGAFFEYNYKHQRTDIIISRQDGLKPYNNNVIISKVPYTTDRVFLDQDRCVHQGDVGYHSKGSWSYGWNIHNNVDTIFGMGIVAIVFINGGKENYCKYAYNYTGNNDKSITSLASKALTSISAEHLSGNYFFAIPQIDWQNIHINQKELWDKGLYDEAVLAEMHLKWNEDKTKIIQA